MIKATRIVILLFFLGFGSAFHLTAQNTAEKSNVIRTIGEKKYFIHTVQKNQSIYAICKIYGLDQQTFFHENPDAIEGIKPGDELRIPFKTESTPVVIQSPVVDSFLWHKVEKSETIYGIAKKYGLTEKQLTSMNPEIGDGLKEGQRIRVGKKKNDSTSTNSNLILKPDSIYDWCIIKPGESLEQIARNYSTTSQKIITLNGNESVFFKVGNRIRVREKVKLQTIKLIDSFEKQVGNSIRIEDSVHVAMRPLKEVYRIGLFLPITTAEAKSTEISSAIQNRKKFPFVAAQVTDFYEGYKLALDSILQQGFKIETEIFDVNENDSASAVAITKSAGFKDLDLIIGPLHAPNFRLISRAAALLQIPCVSPTLTQNKILFQQFYTSKILPSKNHLLDCLAQFAADSFRNYNLVLINAEKAKEQNLNRYFCNSYNTYVRSKYPAADTLHEVKGLNGLKSVYSEKKKNVAILLSENTVYLTDFYTQLSLFLNDKKEMTMMGSSVALNVSSLDMRYLNRLKYLCAAPYYIAKDDTLTSRIWERYQSTFASDPEDIFFQSYDLSFYYLYMLTKHGPDFPNKLATVKAKGISMDFNFYSPDAETGFDNRCGKILQIQDFNLIRVR